LWSAPFGQEVVEELARYATVPVINALTDLHHPCQVLSDLMTVIEEKGALGQLKTVWIGDGNNMANSWIEAASVFGFPLTLACPAGFSPNEAILERARTQPHPIVVLRDPAEAIRGADVVNVDVWASMGQEAEQEQRLGLFQAYQLNAALLAKPTGKPLFSIACLPIAVKRSPKRSWKGRRAWSSSRRKTKCTSTRRFLSSISPARPPKKITNRASFGKRRQS
jgi:ornithine carbamoyltransferase